VNYDSPADIRRTLADLGVTLKKRWGQNFLINRGARDRILELIDPRPGEAVWEIGPGLGCLTAELAGRCRLLVAFEIDHGLIRFLSESFGARDGFVLEAGDAVQRWAAALERHGLPDKVVGNLPYSAASALIGSFAQEGFAPKRMVFMVQRELAARLSAAPGGKSYSSFSALCQHAYRVREQFSLRPGSFYPAPQVQSAVVLLEPRAQQETPAARALFHSLVQAAFRSRRKTLWNNLQAWSADNPPEGLQRLRDALREERIDPGSRAEQLDPERLAALARRLASSGSSET
jgi:16S rRNA (adenine1518-N6/adenine1519-N6)-dimethyltransferase